MTRERGVAALTLACCIALVGWALVPAEGAGELTLAGGPGDLPTATSGGSGSTDVTTGPGGTVAGGTAPGAGGAGTPGATQPGGGSGGGATGGGLTASDIGVTAREITIGVGLIDLGGLASAGFGVGLRGDEPEAAEALVDAINTRGGINGRTVKAHFYSVDPINESDARAACLRATEQHRVFAYVDTLSQYSASQQACFAIEHGTPIVTPTPLSAEFQAKAFPNHISTIQNDNRTVIGMALLAKQHGFFDAAKGFEKLGILDDTCEPEVNADLKRTLARIGIGSDRISEFTLDCDGNNAAAQTSQAALAHKRAGVTHVAIVTQYVQLQLYATAAASQLFEPRYLVSDFGGLTADVSVENMDPDQFDGALGITSSFSGAAAVGKPLSALANECNRALQAHGLPPMRNVTGADGLVAYLCETLTMFERLATLAGPNLTRRGFTGALPSIGTFRGAYTDTAIFDRPGKTSGGDTLAVVQWYRRCTCYRQLVAHTRAPA